MASAKGTQPGKRGPKPGVQYPEISIPEPEKVRDDEMAQAVIIARGRQSHKYDNAISRLMDGQQIAYRNITENQRKTIIVGLRQQVKSKNKMPNIHLDLQFGWIDGTKTLVVWNASTEETEQ
jgi:hypothetical protein